MTLLPSAAGHKNDNDNNGSATAPGSSHESPSSMLVLEHNPYALVLALIPLLTIFGNGLVILAVRRDKSLQTVTNLLIVSLASADLLVALCVMFFAVYFEWNSFIWDLGPTLCNLYIGADVACSTASILNLLAISIDRYIAISHPLAYCQIGTNSRAYLFIALVWGVSISVAIPVAFGANHIESEHECAFTNPLFMIGSSLFSFFLPCLAMIALYAVVFRRLRDRERARAARKRTAMMSGVESALIANALMGGAKMARQIARSHLKDQLLLELSLQTSSFPTGSPSEEGEEEEEEDEYEDEDEYAAFESEGSTRRGRRRAAHHQHRGTGPTMPPRRPTFCLMMNGDMPFPMAPMNPLQLPMTTLRSEAERRVKGWRRKRTLRLLRRCNTLPSAVLRHHPLEPEKKDSGIAATDTVEHTANQSAHDGPAPEITMTKTNVAEPESETELLLPDNIACEERRKSAASGSSMAGDLHEDTRSFGDELEERQFPFIDRSFSAASSLISGGAARKWSQQSATSAFQKSQEKRDPVEEEPLRHNSYAGFVATSRLNAFPDRRRPSSALPTAMVPVIVKQTDGNNNNSNNASDPQLQRLSLAERRLPGSGGDTLLATNLSGLQHLLLSSNLSLPNLVNATPSPSRKYASGIDFNHNETTEAEHPPEADTGGGRKESEGTVKNGGMVKEAPEGRKCSNNERRAAEKRTSFWSRLVRWTIGSGKGRGTEPRPGNGGKMDGVIESARASTIGCTRHSATTTILADPRSSSMGGGAYSHHRSVRITHRALPEERLAQVPVPLPAVVEARNGSCPLVKMDNNSSSNNPPPKKISTTSTAFSSSPLRYIRQAFRRSLVPIIEEGRRPSRQLLKRATRQMRREQKATVTLAIVLAVFLCCWVPFFALHLSNAICLLSGGSQCVHMLAMFLSTWLGYLNSSLNPLIYTVFDKRFRKAFRNLLGCAGPPQNSHRRGATAKTVAAPGGSVGQYSDAAARGIGTRSGTGRRTIR